MFNNYILKGDILYIEIDINYEFGSFNKNNGSFIDELKKYISKIKTNNNFNKIVITCSGIVIGSLLFLNNNKNIDKNNIKYVPEIKETVFFISNDSDILHNNEIESEKSDNSTVVNSKNTSKERQNTVNYEHNTNVSSTQDSVTQPSVSNSPTITVHRASGEVINIGLEDYIIGVIASEMPASFNIEALKAQSVLARTYALKSKETGKILTDTVSTQSYINENEMRNKWGSSFDTYYNKIKTAVNSTTGQYLSYNGNYIEALYHSTNNGKTESSLDVFGNYYPYLVSVSSEFDKSASSYLRTATLDFNTISSKLGISFNNDSIIEILSYTDGGNIREIKINDKTFTGRQFRELLGLRSADFDINFDGNNAIITTRGFGHGVGMSQYGANGMANAGYDYKSILNHYYPGATLSN